MAAAMTTKVIRFDEFGGAIPIATTHRAAKKQGLLDIGAAHVIVTDEAQRYIRD